jgi:hypothetical protein
MVGRLLVRLTIIVVLGTALAAPALAQYGGGGSGSMGGTGGYSAPKGGYSSATGIGIGAGVAAGATVAYLVLHNRHRVVGCVEPSADGNKLLNEKDKNTYALVASNEVVVAPGERVALQGKVAKDGSGKLTFEAQKLVKDYGSCKQ